MEYFTFGQKVLRITQNYNGTTSHKPHWYKAKKVCDYPIDIAGKDGGKDPYYAPVDMKVVAIKGKGNSMTNTIWLVATKKCMTPSGEMTPFIALTHWNDNDNIIKKLKVGSIVKKGQLICEEGKDGATANHLHLVCGNADKGCGDDLIKNGNKTVTGGDVWVSNGYCMKPEEVMFIDKSFTTVKSAGRISFKDKPKQEVKKKSFFDSNGYFGLGDNHKNIGKVAEFMYKKFPKYTNKKALGNYYGKYIQASIKEFQKRTGLEADGNVGPITLKELKKYGFKE